jgi:hypothetical protein
MNRSRRCNLRLRWILGLIVLTLALALAACGGGGDEEEENGGDEGESPAATKTVEAEGTPEVVETSKPEKTEEPSGGGGGASLGDVPVYPGADKVGDYSGSDVPLPLLGEGLDTEEYKTSEWAVYETGDSVDDVAAFYKDKMPDNGWKEENWFDTSMGDGVAWGGYTKNDGDNAAWVAISGSGDKTEIVIGTGSK